MDGTTSETQAVTDGFHLLIDALKLNGVETIYNVPGIPITDLGRYAQAQGLRVLSFRHEQHAGYAAAAAGFLTGPTGWAILPIRGRNQRGAPRPGRPSYVSSPGPCRQATTEVANERCRWSTRSPMP